MSIEDRVRAATRARADLVTGFRPLELPESPARARRTDRPRRTDSSRRWLSWGAPLAAAALVVALAVTLVVVRQAGGPPPGTGTPASSASAASTSALASVPRYYVYVTYASGAGYSMRAVVGDDQTGRALATLKPPSAESFYGVTGASDDRTFVVMDYSDTTKQTTFYLLLLGLGGHVAHFSKLPIKPISAQVNALALSPDGQELAVTWSDSSAKTTTYLSVYSVRAGVVLDSYLTRDDTQMVDGEFSGEALSWVNGDRALDFSWAVGVRSAANPAQRTNPYYLTMRGLNLSAGDHDLLADSQQLMKLPVENWSAGGTASALYPCASSLAVSDGTLVCGSSGSSNVESAQACAQVPVTLTTYSALTSRQLSVLYASHGQPCGGDQAQVLWTDPDASHVLVLILRMETQNQADTQKQAEQAVSSFGVVTGGHLITLPRPTGSGWPASILTSPSGIAF